MIRPPSNQRQYDTFFSGDPAFAQLPDKATPDQIAEHERKWQIARETGDYRSLVIEGAGDPTTFTMRPIPLDAYTVLFDMIKSKKAGDGEVGVLAFRAALVSVANLGKVEIRRVQHEKLGVIATTEFLDKAELPAGLSMLIAAELGWLAFNKASAPSPKS